MEKRKEWSKALIESEGWHAHGFSVVCLLSYYLFTLIGLNLGRANAQHKLYEIENLQGNTNDLRDINFFWKKHAIKELFEL